MEWLWNQCVRNMERRWSKDVSSMQEQVLASMRAAHVSMRTCAHACTHSCSHPQLHTCAHAGIHVCMHAGVYATCTHTHTPRCAHAQMHRCKRALMRGWANLNKQLHTVHRTCKHVCEILNMSIQASKLDVPVCLFAQEPENPTGYVGCAHMH